MTEIDVAKLRSLAEAEGIMNYEEALDVVIDAIESEATLEVSLQAVSASVIESLAKQIVHVLGCKAESTVEERDAAIARAERAEAVEAAIREVLFKPYTGSPDYERTPEHVKEIDAIRALYGESLAADLLAALDAGKEKNE